MESEESSQIKIAAPIFLLIGLIMLICATILYILRYFVKQREQSSPYELSNGMEILQKERPVSQMEVVTGPLEVSGRFYTVKDHKILY